MLWFIFKALLFVAYVPGVLFRLYPSGSLRTQALLHGILYIVIVHLAYQSVHTLKSSNPIDTKNDQPCPAGSHKCPSGDCILDGDKHSPCRN